MSLPRTVRLKLFPTPTWPLSAAHQGLFVSAAEGALESTPGPLRVLVAGLPVDAAPATALAAELGRALGRPVTPEADPEGQAFLVGAPGR